MTVIEGGCDARFALVRDAFANNFVEHNEIGAAVCLSVHGQVVVDLWGGWADHERTRPWERDTLVNVFSIGKGLTAALAAQAVGTGELDVSSPVARWWPEFAAAGKSEVTVAHLLSHQAGLPAIRQPLARGTMLDWTAMTDLLAAHEPWWVPGAAHGYHVNTFGFLVGEVLRRVTGRSVGALLQERLAGPIGADVHIGLPRSEHGRAASFLFPEQPDIELPEMSDMDLMRVHTYANPRDLSGAGVVNSEAWRLAEIPSTNGHGTARGVERIYAALVGGGAVGGVRVVEAGALAAATVEQVHGEDLILGRRSRFGLGFQLTQAERPLGPGGCGFGHFGAGGSLGFCHPESGVALGYVMNAMGARWQNPRNKALLDAVFASLG